MKLEAEIIRLQKEIIELLHKNNFEIFDIEIDEFLIRFVLEQKDKICCIYWSFFIDKFRPNEINFSNVTYGSGIVFKKVNEILNNVINIDIKTENTVSKFPSFNNDLDLFFVSKVPVISNSYFQEGNFISIMKLIVRNISEYHLPFFQKVSSLQVVNDEIIDKVPQMELGNYIPGQYMNAKVLIIMKLCNNPNYENYKNWLKNVYQPMLKENPEKYISKYELILSTIEFLDSGKYSELI